MRYNVGDKPGAGRHACAGCGWKRSLDDRRGSLPAGPEWPSGQNATYRPATAREVR